LEECDEADAVGDVDADERALDAAALVAKLSTASARRDAVAARAKQLLETGLLTLSDDICKNPEIGYKETRSVQKLAETLRKHNFGVEVGVGGFDTAFVARFKGGRGGRPQMGVIVEYDALRGTNGAFHGDQHCAQGPIGIAACLERSPSSARPPRSCSSPRRRPPCTRATCSMAWT
jgi:hypothetical protein